MNTLKAKLIFGVAVISILIGAQAVLTSTLAGSSVENMNQAQHVGVRGALLGNRIKFDVVQVQQWLTDISATRALDGLNDGIDVAAEFADDFQIATDELEALRPDLGPELAELRATFAVYHATGIEMANAYIEGGPTSGNRLMGEFDTAAAAMGDTVDALVTELLDDSTTSLDDASASATQVKTVALVASLAIAALAALCGTVIITALTRQLKTVTAAASQIAAGNLSVEPLPAHDRDSLGKLAMSFNEMTAVLGSVEAQAHQIAAGNITANQQVPGDLGRAFDAMTDSLSTMIDQLSNSSGQLSTAANGLTTIAARVSDGAGKTVAEATSASSAGADVSTRVATVAAAIEQMNSSIHEVSTSAAQAAAVATEAVEIAGQTSQTIAKLGESSEEIDNVITVIQTIAEQTNLLALNATIEAARAGEAGKGFAVVASEVKDLAVQTAEATHEISNRIVAIQGDATDAVEANSRISETIDRINEISTTIASAVEEQSVTTAEIGRNVEEAATSSEGIAASIADVATAADDTRESIEDTRSAADELSRMADELGELVGHYN